MTSVAHCHHHRCFSSKPMSALILLSVLCCSEKAHAFSVGSLLSSCIDACDRGCAQIRRVQSEQETNGVEFVLKDPNDSRSALTIADQAAQDAIIGSLRATWGDELTIIGEEDDDTKDNEKAPVEYEPLIQTLLDDDLGDELPEIDADSVTVFVDPLDGTREFCEGRLENCQVLVGIAIDGQPVAGAIGLPFPTGNASTPATLVYGLDGVGTGTRGAPLLRGPWPSDAHLSLPRPHFATGDSPVPCMAGAVAQCTKLFGGSQVVLGGAGNKILAAAVEQVAGSIQHKVGGPWDLCAPQAILQAMGGQMTNLFGDPIACYGRDPKERDPEFGYIATPVGSDHETIVRAINNVPEVQAYREEVQYDAYQKAKTVKV